MIYRMTTVTKTQWVLVNGIIFHEITPNGFILGIDNVRRIFFKKIYDFTFDNLR